MPNSFSPKTPVKNAVEGSFSQNRSFHTTSFFSVSDESEIKSSVWNRNKCIKSLYHSHAFQKRISPFQPVSIRQHTSACVRRCIKSLYHSHACRMENSSITHLHKRGDRSRQSIPDDATPPFHTKSTQISGTKVLETLKLVVLKYHLFQILPRRA